MAGKQAGQSCEGDRRFELVVRLPETLRTSLDVLSKLKIELPVLQNNSDALTRSIPLTEVAEITFTTGPNQVSRENGKRRVFVTANVRGRDLGSFVKDVQAMIEKEVSLPECEYLTPGVAG